MSLCGNWPVWSGPGLANKGVGILVTCKHHENAGHARRFHFFLGPRVQQKLDKPVVVVKILIN